MPLAAIFAAAIFKMILMPLIGTFLVIGLRSTTTLFPRDQKSMSLLATALQWYIVLIIFTLPVLSFTAFLLAGTPSAVNQVRASPQSLNAESEELRLTGGFCLRRL